MHPPGEFHTCLSCCPAHPFISSDESNDPRHSDDSSSQLLFHQEKSDETAPCIRFPLDKPYPGSASLSDSPLRDQDSPPSPPLAQSLDNILPLEPSLSISQDASFQPEPPKRRPLPTPPSSLQHASPSPRFSSTSEIIPASPPPPYSRFLPDDDPEQMSRHSSNASPPTAFPAPEAPVIMSPLPNEQGAHSRAPYDSFLCHSPPANTWIAVETSLSEYVLLVRLPSFRRDGMQVHSL